MKSQQKKGFKAYTACHVKQGIIKRVWSAGRCMSLTRKRRSTGKVTLADVAQLAGVGTMTVSRALRTPEQVSDKLREKIEAAVQELGYMPNLAASALASASSWTIAMVVPNLSEAGCSEMFAGLQQVLQPAGYQIMLAESSIVLNRKKSCWKRCWRQTLPPRSCSALNIPTPFATG
jgi:hypothetical protein